MVVEIQRYEALDGRLAEFVERDAAVEVGIGGNDRFGEVEQPVATGTLVGVVAAAAWNDAATAATASAMPPPPP